MLASVYLQFVLRNVLIFFLHWEMSGQLKNVGFIFIALQPSGRFIELCQVLFSESNSKTHSYDFLRSNKVMTVLFKKWLSQVPNQEPVLKMNEGLIRKCQFHFHHAATKWPPPQGEPFTKLFARWCLQKINQRLQHISLADGLFIMPLARLQHISMPNYKT